jgi:hypothetical protein
MKTKTITLYNFDELTPEAQEKAIQNLWDINVDYSWWEFTYDDAKEIGLNITGFDLDHQKITGEFINSALSCAQTILLTHGEMCETYKTAAKYQSTLASDNDHNEFLLDLLEDYRMILQQDYDYRTSKTSIIETIKANEYTFTENGKLENI